MSDSGGEEGVRWTYAGHSYEGGPFEMRGVDVWQAEWVRVDGQRACVNDPHYGQDYVFDVFELRTQPGLLRFAAGEFSANVWGFYVSDADP